MKCHSAQRGLSAARDGTLAPRERAELDEHLAGCAQCRRMQNALTATIDHWRTANAKLAGPSAERTWQDVRRAIRTDAPAKAREGWSVPRWVLPVAAAVVLGFGAVLAPRWLNDATSPNPHRAEIARADFVETPAGSSSLVYLDDKSGWLVAWAVNDNDKM